MNDPDFLADAKKMKIEVSFTDAEKVQQILNQIYQTPPEVTDRVKKALAFTQ